MALDFAAFAAPPTTSGQLDGTAAKYSANDTFPFATFGLA
jgi:hypothetical protein